LSQKWHIAAGQEGPVIASGGPIKFMVDRANYQAGQGKANGRTEKSWGTVRGHSSIFEATYSRARTRHGLPPESLRSWGSSATQREPPMICGAKNRRGLPCQCKKLYGNGRCRFHGGLSTGPKTPEGKQRSLDAMRAGQKKWINRRQEVADEKN
jgi:hypothetical protein